MERTRATSNAPASEHEDRHERERHPGDQRAEDRDRRRRPHANERAVLPERGGERVAHGAHSLPGGPRRKRACATLRLPRCVRTRAPPGPARCRSGSSHHGAPHSTMFDTLSERLRKTLDGLTGRGRISEADVDAAMREIRLVAARGGRQLQGRQGLRGARSGTRGRCRGAREPHRRPAGREDRARRARRAPVGRGPGVPPDRQPGGRGDGRPAGLGQDDLDGQAGAARHQAGSPPAARGRRPVPAGRRRPARDARSPARRSGLPRTDRHRRRRHRPRRHRGGEAPGARRRDPRHGRPPHRRRGADGRDLGRRTTRSSRSRPCSSSMR